MRPFPLLLPLFHLVHPLPTTNQLIALASASASPIPPTPLPPSLDPWYRAPSTPWASTPPGTVLKIRAAPLLNRTIGNALTAYQILYRTTDSQHDASWAVTTILVPVWQARCSTTTTHLCAHAVLSYQIPYDTCNVDASPSYGLNVVGEPYGEVRDALGLGCKFPLHEEMVVGADREKGSSASPTMKVRWRATRPGSRRGTPRSMACVP